MVCNAAISICPPAFPYDEPNEKGGANIYVKHSNLVDYLSYKELGVGDLRQ